MFFDNSKEYYSYLELLKKEEKIEWTKRIVNTDMDVLAIPVPELKKIAKEILKSDYIKFLDMKMLDNYESTIVYGSILNNIKDFNILKKYLDIYVDCVDNWSSCDVLSFKIIDDNLFNLALSYTKSEKPFVRRVGFRIFFKYLDNEIYFKKIFKVLDNFYYEDHYYVNMIIAWLLCEAFIKNRNMTLEYLKNAKLSVFVVNKTVSKCRDSYRVCDEDKEMLFDFKRKICQKK